MGGIVKLQLYIQFTGRAGQLRGSGESLMNVDVTFLGVYVTTTNFGSEINTGGAVAFLSMLHLLDRRDGSRERVGVARGSFDFNKTSPRGS